MLLALGCILAGIPLGFLLRRHSSVVRGTTTLSTVVIYLLLFFLGSSVGGNHELINNFTSLGAKGVCAGLLCALCSALATLCLQKFLASKVHP